jgi:glutamate synthase domain-containing protein 3
VVVLGSVGYNFGAGMTGGYAYVLDPELPKKINTSYVLARRLISEAEKERVKETDRQALQIHPKPVGKVYPGKL